MGRVKPRKRKAKAKVVVAATEKAQGKPGKITLKIQQKSSKSLVEKDRVDLRGDSDDNGRQLRPDEEGQQNEDLIEVESEDDKFEEGEDKEEEEEEDDEEDEISAPSPPSRTAVRAKIKKGLSNTKDTVKTTSSSRSTKQSNTKKPFSSSSNSTLRKPLPKSASKSTSKSRQKVIPIVSDSNEDTEEEETRVSDLEISNDEEERVVKRGAKIGPPERDPEIDIFEFELHWRCHFEEKDVDKNVEFKEINGISYDVRFSFARFFEKQVEKARLHAIETFGVNAACQVVKVEAEVKFNRATKGDLASLKLDIEHPPTAWTPVEKLLKHRYKFGKN